MPDTDRENAIRAELVKREMAKRGLDTSNTDPNIEQVRTLEGDTVPVFRTVGKKLAGYVGGEPKYGESFKMPPESERQGASLPAQFKASITQDPAAKARIFARDRGEKRERYRTTEDGRVFRRGDDGVYYPMEVETPGGKLVSMVAKAPRAIGRMAVEGAGYAMKGPVGAGLTVAATEIGERLAAKKLVGERTDRPEQDYVINPVIQGGTAVVSGLVAKGVSKPINPAARAIARTGQTGRLIKNTEPVDAAAIQRRGELFKRFKIPTSAGRTTQSSTLMSVERDLGGMPGEAGDIIRGGERITKSAIPKALVRGTGGLPKTDVGTTKAGKALVGAARGIKEGLLKRRSREADILYGRAFRSAAGVPIQTAKTVGLIQDGIKDAANKEQRQALQGVLDEMVVKRMPVTKITQLDKIQKSIGRQARKAIRDGNGDVAEKLYEVRRSLIDDISTISPDYARATRVYKASSEAIERFEGEFKKSLLERLTKVEKDYVHKAPEMLFGPESSPALVESVKRKVVNYSRDGVKKWAAITRGALSKELSTLDESLAIPAEKMAIMKSALSPKKYEALEAFQKALGYIGNQPWAGAAPSAAQGRLVLEEQIGGIAGKAKLMTPSPYIQSREWVRRRVSKAAPDIARELSTNAGAKKILRLKQLSPGSLKWVEVMTFLGINPVAQDKVGKLIKEE